MVNHMAALRLASAEALPVRGGGSKPLPIVATTETHTVVKVAMRSWIHPTGRPPIFVTKQLQVGPHTTISGITPAGVRASAVISTQADLVPAWSRRFASLMCIADMHDSGFDKVIKDLLSRAGWQTDTSVDWDAALNNMFKAKGIWPSDPDRREEAIQEAIVNILVIRDAVNRFDPSKITYDGEDPIPNYQRITRWLLGLFNYYTTAKGGARDKALREAKELGVDMTTYGHDAPHDEAHDIWENMLEDTNPSPEDRAVADSDASSMQDSLAHLSQFISKRRPKAMADKEITILNLIQGGATGADVSQGWADLGFSTSYFHKALTALREDIRVYRTKTDAPQSRLLDMMNTMSIPDPKPAPAGAEKDSVTQVVSAIDDGEPHPFIASLIACVTSMMKDDHANKQAKPEVVKEYILYLKLIANPKDPRKMDLSFYSVGEAFPGFEPYTIEVGDWETDRGLNERKIRQQLNTLVIPSMRDDVLDGQQALLEKVIYRLRTIVWENAIDYFQTPLADKPQWRNVVKMDVQKLKDVRVQVRDRGLGSSVTLAASLHESTLGKKAARPVSSRSLSGEENLTPAEQTDFAPLPDKSSVTAGEGKQAHAPGHAYGTESGAVVCRSCATKDGGASNFPKTYTQDSPDLSGKTCSRCFKSLGKPAITAGRQEEDARQAGSALFDPAFCSADDEPALVWMAEALKGKGLKDDADNMATAIEGYLAARDAHFDEKTHKESSMTRTKFASLKRLAAENPQAINEAIDYLKSKLTDSLNNLTVMQEGIGAVTLDANGENPVPVEGPEKFASLRHIAAEDPGQIEEALNEFYGDMEEVKALTENLADQLDVDLQTPGVPDEEKTEETDPESSEETGTHDEVPPAEEPHEDKKEDE